MKKLLSITLALVMCLGSLCVGFTASAEGENLLAGASYTYEVGTFFSTFTDDNNTLLTDGKWRGDGQASFNGMYAVAGTTVELFGDNGGELIDNVIVFNFKSAVAIDYLVFRGVRRIGNRYTNIAAIETSYNGTAYTEVDFTEKADPISGAPQLGGSDQYFDITTTFSSTATKVKYLKITLNTLDLSGTLQYLVQMDEIEAYGSATGKYTPAAEVSVSAEQASVRPGEYVTVTVLVDNISTPNGVVALDLPLSYDNTLLRLVSCEGIYPASWGNTGAVAGDSTMAQRPYWLRLFCDADDLAANKKYGVKEDGVLGFTLRFKALSTGVATVTVDNVPENGDFMLVVNGADFENYGATGSSTEITISGEAVVPTVIRGDVNGDGVVSNLDASYVLRYDAALVDFDEETKAIADVNDDGVVNNLDAGKILRYDAGLIPEV